MKKRVRRKLWSLFLVFVSAGLLLTGGTILWAATLDIPDFSSFEKRKVEQSTKIYDRTGEVLLWDLHADIQRTVVSLGDVSRYVKNATVAIEDAEFYEHNGIKPTAIIRAILVNALSLRFEQGGSTITQQVVKNSILTQEKLISRKIKEWVLSLRLEQELSKEKILELYLNEVPYGGNIYGIEEASRSFFGKPASEVTLAEAAYLSALPQAPTYYSPYGRHRDDLESRKNLVLSRMLENGFITKEEFSSASEATVEFQPRVDTGIRAPHFVFFVVEQLEQKYGRRALEERGFRIITSLDWNLQERAERIVKKFALENEEKFNAENASLVATDPKTGDILVMVGSRDYFDEEIDGNFNVALANRQPGSAFKPFVYAAAFAKGYTPETIVFDARTQFSTACNEANLTSDGACYSPGNYDFTFRGPVTFRDALAQSINIPAIKALYLAGLSDALALAKSMGITSLTDINRYGLTLVLGGGEVSLLEMVGAYSVFANNGIRSELRGILRVENANGDLVEEFQRKQTTVLDEEVAYQISDILSDNTARTPAFGANSPLYFPGRDVAAKTGTTNDSRDAWIVGYTPTISVGAWAGNNDNSPMVKQVAGFIIAPLWNTFMNEALPIVENENFRAPRQINDDGLKPVLRGKWLGGESFFIDTITRKLATQFTPSETKEEVVIPNIHSILHWVDKDNPRGSIPKSPAKDPQYRLWEFGVTQWKSANGYSDSSVSIPTEEDDVHLPEFFPQFSINSPQNNIVVNADERIFVSLSIASGRFKIREVEYYLNGVFIGKTAPQGAFSFIPSDHGALSGGNTLRVVVVDSVYNRGERDLSFSIK